MEELPIQNCCPVNSCQVDAKGEKPESGTPCLVNVCPSPWSGGTNQSRKKRRSDFEEAITGTGLVTDIHNYDCPIWITTTFRL